MDLVGFTHPPYEFDAGRSTLEWHAWAYGHATRPSSSGSRKSLRALDRRDACACWGCVCHESCAAALGDGRAIGPLAPGNSYDVWSWISWIRNLRATAGGTDRRPPTGVAKDPIMRSDGRAFKVISRRSLEVMILTAGAFRVNPLGLPRVKRPIGRVGRHRTGIARLPFYVRSWAQTPSLLL